MPDRNMTNAGLIALAIVCAVAVIVLLLGVWLTQSMMGRGMMGGGGALGWLVFVLILLVVAAVAAVILRSRGKPRI